MTRRPPREVAREKPTHTQAILANLSEAIDRGGLLLLQDKLLPDVVSLLVGEKVRGSWWAHPRSHEIFRRLTEIGAHPDVLFTKLVLGKVTLVHRRLWPALFAVATSREPWQIRELSRQARALLRKVDAGGEIAASGAAVKEFEMRILILAREEHTESGAP